MAHGFTPSSSRLVTLHRQVWYKVKIFALDGILRPRRPMDMLRFGTYYGGWWIPGIDPGQGAAICVGAGLDVSFDLELLRLGYRVYTVDPTPASIDYVTKVAPQLILVPVGIWKESGELGFTQDRTYSDSWAIGSAGHSSVRLERFPVITIKELLRSICEPRVAILKLDIEGAEHTVLRSMIHDEIRPACLCIEFDDQRLRKILGSARSLRRFGYELFQIENFNFTFVRKP